MLLPLFLCAVDYPSCFCGVASLNGTSSCASTDCDLCQTPQRKDLALASLTFIVKFEVRSHGVLLRESSQSQPRRVLGPIIQPQRPALSPSPVFSEGLSGVVIGRFTAMKGSDFDSESNLVLPTVGWCTNCRTVSLSSSRFAMRQNLAVCRDRIKGVCR